MPVRQRVFRAPLDPDELAVDVVREYWVQRKRALSNPLLPWVAPIPWTPDREPSILSGLLFATTGRNDPGGMLSDANLQFAIVAILCVLRKATPTEVTRSFPEGLLDLIVAEAAEVFGGQVSG